MISQAAINCWSMRFGAFERFAVEVGRVDMLKPVLLAAGTAFCDVPLWFRCSTRARRPGRRVAREEDTVFAVASSKGFF